MVDIKQIQKNIKDKSCEDQSNYNMYLRSQGVSADRFKYTDSFFANGVPILAKRPNRKNAPNHNVTTEIFNQIRTQKASYFASNIKRVYLDDLKENKELLDKYKVFDRGNHIKRLYKTIAKSVAGWGVTYTLSYLIKDNTEMRIKEINAWNAYIEYDDESGDPILGIVYGAGRNEKDGRYNTGYRKTYYMYVYDDVEVKTYKSSSKYENYKLIDTKKHGFEYMPLVEWRNNEDSRGNAELAVRGIDCLEALISDNATEAATLSNAYMFLKDMGTLTEKDLEMYEKTGAVSANGERADFKFVIKDINPEFIKTVKDWVYDAIWIAASAVDPKVIMSTKELRKFQAEQMYSLLEASSEDTINEWEESLERLDKLCESYFTGLATPSIADYDTYDIEYVFPRNIPEDRMANINEAVKAGAMYPDWYLIQAAENLSEDKSRELAEEARNENTMAEPTFE